MSGLRVLVVEDEPLIQMTLVEMIAELRHQVIAAVGTVDRALEVVHETRLDVVLLDVNISGELSYDVANHCTVEGIPVIITTGYTAADLPEGLKHCPILSKPYSVDQLKDAINSATG